MFSHIATSIKNIDQIKSLWEDSNKLNMDDYKKEMSNLSDLLIIKSEDKEDFLNKMYTSLLTGRSNSILVIIGVAPTFPTKPTLRHKM